jgi:hypothetical protein
LTLIAPPETASCSRDRSLNTQRSVTSSLRVNGRLPNSSCRAKRGSPYIAEHPDGSRGCQNRWKPSTAGTGAERPNPNPVPRDYAERPAKIRLRLNQRQCHVRSLFGGVRRDAEQDNPTARRQPAAENELAEILVERQEDSLLLCAKSGDVLIRDAGALFSDREDVPTRLSQRLQSRPRGKFSPARILMRF